MSREKYKEESHRWIRQAKADIKAAEICSQNGSHEWASFQSQQAAEKALKAIWYFIGEDPWGHSIVKLLNDFPDPAINHTLNSLMNDAKSLDKLYIPTRYPNGLPELIPADVYTADESTDAINRSKKILETIESIVNAE